MASSDKAMVKFDPGMLQELEVSQRMAAQFLECGYLALRDFPEISKKVRLTADDAQTQHMMSLGLMKKFRSTADHVVETMIPLVREGVEIQVYEIARDAFDTVIGYAKEMKKETETTQKRYYEMKHIVQQHIGEVEEANKKVSEKTQKSKIEMETEMKVIQSMQKEFVNLENERKELQEEIKRSHEARRKFLEKSIQSQEDKDREGFLDSLFVPSVAVVATAVMGGPVYGIAMAVGGWATNYIRRNQTNAQAMAASEKEEQQIDKMKNEKDAKAERMMKLREDGLQKIAMMRKLALDHASLGDVKYLEAASTELGKVSEHLGKIALFWEDFATKIEELVKSQDPAKILLKYIEKPEVAERFGQRLDIVSKYWTSFGSVCLEYVSTNSSNIKHLYKFLSAPVDRMSIKECDDRKRELLENMEKEIKAIEF